MACRPNILVIMVDELNVSATSVYGHPFVHTPNMQRMANAGVTIEHAYCNSPLCVPSRASFMTSRYASDIQVYDLASRLSSEEPTWAHLLNAGGYETVLCGKMHFVGADQRHGFQKRLVEDIHGDGLHHGIPTWDVSHEKRATQPSKRIVDGGKAGKSRYVEYDYTVRDETVRYLENYGKGTKEKPFALCTSFISPHFPLVVEDKFFNLYYPHLADLPAHPEVLDHPKYKRVQQQYNLEGPFTEDSIRRCRAAYYGLVTFVDELIGIILDTLENAGLADNTMVVFTCDHGDMLGERGLWWKSCLLEGSARIPMICVWPGKLPTGERRDNVLSNIDVFPTLLDAAGLDIPGFVAGHSFLPLMQQSDSNWKNEALVECLAHTALHPEAALIKGQYKFLYFMNEPYQLFDLKNDPYELVDLAKLAEYQPLVQEFEHELLSRWPVKHIDQEVRKSQLLRRYVKAGEAAE